MRIRPLHTLLLCSPGIPAVQAQVGSTANDAPLSGTFGNPSCVANVNGDG
jgi:hypothetical protein